MSGSPLAVVAIGGNALIRDEQHQGLGDQAAAVAVACAAVAGLVQAGWRVVVTHGNGPQVGFILRRSEIASAEVPIVPMDYATADTQGAIGSMFQRALYNEFLTRGTRHHAVTLVTHVVVDTHDKAFAAPDKPIGPFFSQARARELAERLGWAVGEDSGRGWRRLVASPRPQRIVELAELRALATEGRVLIACGGGGIPVTEDAAGRLTGVEAVIDKDRTSALLAAELDAQAFVLCTSVDRIATGWGTPQARPREHLNPTEAAQLLARGEFGAGSMAPKVEAALAYLAGRPASARAVIGRLDDLSALVTGGAGTRIGL